MSEPITIVGGGLGGLMLGILLRQRNIPVAVIEAGAYPRHRVCGEFISGRGARLLREAGLLEGVPAVENRTVRFFAGGRSSAVLALPEPAVSASRWSLDHRLARTFETLGGSLRLNARWAKSFEAPGVVRATGRRAASGPGSFTGLKVHAKNARPSADLELHFSAAGYAGIARLPDGEANICGLFKRGVAMTGTRGNPAAVFREIIGAGLPGEMRDESFCAVAGIEMDGSEWENAREFRIGDTMSVIPPLTGNGMSLALESASLAVEPLTDFARGRAEWGHALERFSQNCKRTFRRRLRVSSFLQKALVGRRGTAVGLSCLRTVPRLLPFLFRLTR